MEYNDVEIKSMAEYIQWVDETHRFCNSDKVTFAIENVYYRGQASKDWGLSPSVFRENYNEFELFQKAKKIAENIKYFTFTIDITPCVCRK